MGRYRFVALAAIFLMSHGVAHATNIELLHEFAGGADDGQHPESALTLDGATLYGTTVEGGSTDAGTIYSINTDGSGFDILHDFVGGPNGGTDPLGDLLLDGSILYGTTRFGGDNDLGTVFSLNTDGSGFQLVHEFAGGANDGAKPVAGLTLSGSSLFGTTLAGGDYDLGTVFSVGTDGSGFTLLHEFAGETEDGALPRGGVALSGSTLYGTTDVGGADNDGTVFSINKQGSDFTLLHEFEGGDDDGQNPRGALVIDDSRLFGTTSGGGDGAGTLFTLGTDGGEFTLLHEFTGPDGLIPVAGLTFSDSTLFGTTLILGANGNGTLYSINTDGSKFQVLHDFAGGPDDGSLPGARLTVDGSTVIGTTVGGGDNQYGTVFSIQLPEPTAAALLCVGMAVCGVSRRRRAG